MLYEVITHLLGKLQTDAAKATRDEICDILLQLKGLCRTVTESTPLKT